MRGINIIFVGEDIPRRIIKHKLRIDKNFKGGASSQDDEYYVAGEQSSGGGGTTEFNDRLNALKQIIGSGLRTAAPSVSQNVPQFDDDSLRQAMMFAAPDLDNSDYYVNPDTNPVVASASNKTLGTFPIFAAATLAPHGMWDKRRKAVSDYMMQLEAAKSKQLNQKLDYEPPLVEGDANWMGVINQKAIDEQNDLQQYAASRNVPMAGVNNIGHPLSKPLRSIINNQKSNMKLVTDIGQAIKKVEESGLSYDNAISKDVMQDINLWKYVSSLPDDEPIEIGGVPYKGKYELLDSPFFKETAYEILKNVNNKSSLLSLAKQRTSEIEKKLYEDYQMSGSHGSYDEYKRTQLSSKYPLIGKKNPITGEQEMSSDTFLDKLAMQIAQQYPTLFKDKELADLKQGLINPRTGSPLIDASGEQPDAPYTLSQFKNIVASNLGYDYQESPLIISKGSGSGSGENRPKNTSPQYLVGLATEASKGSAVKTKTGKGFAINGESGTLFNINGEWKLVPYSNKTEWANAALQMGGADNELGDVDANTAIQEIQARQDIYKDVSKTIGNKPRLSLPTSTSASARFNESIKQITGSNGMPISKGVTVKKITPTKDGFYFDGKSDEQKAFSTGVVIPEDLMSAKVSDVATSGWRGVINSALGTSLKDDKKVFIPKDGGAAFIEDAYYHKDEVKKGQAETYTIYKRGTNEPYMFKSSDKTEPDYSITLPAYTVNKMVSLPETLIKESLEKYPEDQDNESPQNVQVKSNTGQATKKGGTGSVYSVQNDSDDDLKVAHILLTNKALGANVNSIDEAIKLAKQYSSSAKASDKNTYNTLLKSQSKSDIAAIRKLYK